VSPTMGIFSEILIPQRTVGTGDFIFSLRSIEMDGRGMMGPCDTPPSQVHFKIKSRKKTTHRKTGYTDNRTLRGNETTRNRSLDFIKGDPSSMPLKTQKQETKIKILHRMKSVVRCAWCVPINQADHHKTHFEKKTNSMQIFNICQICRFKLNGRRISKMKRKNGCDEKMRVREHFRMSLPNSSS